MYEQLTSISKHWTLNRVHDQSCSEKISSKIPNLSTAVSSTLSHGSLTVSTCSVFYKRVCDEHFTFMKQDMLMLIDGIPTSTKCYDFSFFKQIAKQQALSRLTCSILDYIIVQLQMNLWSNDCQIKKSSAKETFRPIGSTIEKMANTNGCSVVLRILLVVMQLTQIMTCLLFIAQYENETFVTVTHETTPT